MLMKKMLVAAILAVFLIAPFAADAQQRAGTVAGMSPAVAAAAGLGVVLAGVLIANEIGSSGGSQFVPPDDDDDDDDMVPPVTTPVTPVTPVTPTTPGT